MICGDNRDLFGEDTLLALLSDPEAAIERLEAAIAAVSPAHAEDLLRQRDELRAIFLAPPKARRSTE